MPLSDFDFLIGRWTIRCRALRAPQRKTADWCVFEAVYDCRRIGQLGNVGYLRTSSGEFPMEGVSVRLYNPERDEWTISWADSARAGILQPPVVGGFDGGAGVFYGEVCDEGRPVRVRLLWRKSPRPRFEQAYSMNNGRTWETNWLMAFEARGQVAEVRMPMRASG
jgi:hypothetical protein